MLADSQQSRRAPSVQLPHRRALEAVDQHVARLGLRRAPCNLGRSGNGASGLFTEHTYQTASCGLTANGPGVDGAFNLPAYQVKVHTYWVAEWAQAWEFFTWECPEGKERDDGNGPYCTVPEIRVWHNAFEGWFFIDLTKYRNPTYYFDSTSLASPNASVVFLNDVSDRAKLRQHQPSIAQCEDDTV